MIFLIKLHREAGDGIRGEDHHVIALGHGLPHGGVVLEAGGTQLKRVNVRCALYEACINTDHLRSVPKFVVWFLERFELVQIGPNSGHLILWEVCGAGQPFVEIFDWIEETEQRCVQLDVETGAAFGVRLHQRLRCLDHNAHDHHRGDDHGEHGHRHTGAEAAAQRVGNGGA